MYKLIEDLQHLKFNLTGTADLYFDVDYDYDSDANGTIGQTASKSKMATLATRWSTAYCAAKKFLQKTIEKANGIVDSRLKGSRLWDPTIYTMLEELRQTVVAAAEESRANSSHEVDFGWIRRDYGGPMLWDDKNKLLSFCKKQKMAGPFQVVKINMKPFGIEVDQIEYGITNPVSLDEFCENNGIWNGEFRQEDLIADPLIRVKSLEEPEDE